MLDQYIFSGEASKLFYKKLDDLHQKYVYHLLLSGLASEGQDLESIKMTKNPDVSLEYCEKIVGGFKNLTPQLIARLTEDGETRLECVFTKINDNKGLNSLFMVQNVVGWTHFDDFSCQVWYLGEISVNIIEEHWK